MRLDRPKSMSRIGTREQFQFLFNAAVRDARKDLLARQKEAPNSIPPPVLGSAQSAFGMCVIQVTFRGTEQ